MIARRRNSARVSASPVLARVPEDAAFVRVALAASGYKTLVRADVADMRVFYAEQLPAAKAGTPAAAVGNAALPKTVDVEHRIRWPALAIAAIALGWMAVRMSRRL